jgi:hypothetical protein
MASTKKNKTIVVVIEGLGGSSIDAVCDPGLIAHLPAPADQDSFKSFAALLYSQPSDTRWKIRCEAV